MSKWLSVAEIAEQAKVAPRQLRYVLDHRLVVPRSRGGGQGVARTFPTKDAFRMAFAAILLEAGLKRSAIKRLIDVLAVDPMALISQLKRSAPQGDVYYEFADQANFRLSSNGRKPPTVWKQASNHALLDQAYQPAVVIQINLGGLLHLIGQ